MYKWYLLSVTLLLMSIASPTIALSAEMPAPAGVKPAVLFVTTEYNPMYNLYLKQYCREAMVANGFEADIALWNELNWERIKPYNVIVIVTVGHNTAYGKLGPADQQVLDLFPRFIGEGGGLFVSAIEGNRLHVVQKLLMPYGLTIYDEIVKVREPRQMRKATSFNINFSYTTNIKPSPVTKGIEGIWFPVLNLKQWYTLEYIFATDPTWDVLVKGMPYTYSEPVVGAGHYAANEAIVKREKGVESEVPLFAVKETGSGRLAYLAISPVLTYYSGMCAGLDNVVLSKGIGERGSDLGKLLLQTFQWLAEPSMKSAKVGGYKTDAKRIARATMPPEDWILKPSMDYATYVPFKGIIGAESRYSGGASTVAEYKKAAAKAGLDFVAFLEDAALLNDQKYKELIAECQKLSDDKVTLIPGFRIDDESGNHWYSISYTAPFPDKSFFTADGKKFLSVFDPKCGGAIIASARYFTSFFPFFGNYLYNESTQPYWSFGHYCSTALFTYRDGKLVDELLLQNYLEVQDVGNMLSPISVSLIKNAEEIGKAMGAQQYLTVVLKKDRKELAQEGPGFKHQKPLTYVSNGPEIKAWLACVNREYTAFSWFQWPCYRYNVLLKTASKDGLKEVAVYDGPELLRRFLPNGAQEFEHELNLVHQQQKELVLVVTDMKGHKAVSDVLWDSNFLMKDYFLGDRFNKGVYSQQSANTEWGFSYHWNPAVPGLYFMHGAFTDDLFYIINGAELLASGFDGPPGGKPTIRSCVSLDINGQPYLNGWRFARRIDRPLASADIIIGEAGFTHRFPEDCGRWFSLMLPTTESEYYEGKQRYYCFNLKYGMPGIALVEGEVRIKKDVKLADKINIPIRLGIINSGRESGMDTFFSSADGRVVKFNFDNLPQDRNLSGALPKGAYITMFPSCWGRGGSATIYSLTDGLGYYYESAGICIYGFALKGQQMKAGTTLKYRYLAMTGDRKWTPGNLKVEQIRDLMGIDGSAGYKISLEQGKVLSQEFVCRLDGGGEGVAGVFPLNKDMPCTLPVIVENQNDRWTSVLYERNKKRYRPVGVHEHKTYVQLGVGTEDEKLFIGHPFTCDKPDLFITLVQTGDKQFLVDIHNPADVAVRTKIRKSSYFDLVTTDGFEVEIPAGSSIKKEIK